MSAFVHVLTVLVMPPLLQGVINKTKAFFAGRRGPPLLQLYFDLAKLVRKGSIFSGTTTWVFRAGPIVSVATAFLASLLLPLANPDAPVAFAGDLLLFAYLFGLSRFFTAAAALDTGSAFEGMGAAREVSFACLAEPALFFGLMVLVKVSGSLSLTQMLAVPSMTAWGGATASLVLVIAAWFIVLLVENCRIPFDDPNTHLELTMIHEVMVLDHSGPALGFILYGAAMKLFVLGALMAGVLVPYDGGGSWQDWLAFLCAMLALAVVIGAVESSMARLRMVKIPQLLVTACLLGAFGLLLLLR